MRKTCGCPTVPQKLYVVFKPYGASRLFTEPAVVLGEWREEIQKGNPGPVIWPSLRAAICNQRQRSSEPKVNKIDPFCVVAIPSDWTFLEYLEEVLREPSEDRKMPSLTHYKLTPDGIDRLEQQILSPTFEGLWMQLVTAERAEQIYEECSIWDRRW